MWRVEAREGLEGESAEKKSSPALSWKACAADRLVSKVPSRSAGWKVRTPVLLSFGHSFLLLSGELLIDDVRQQLDT